MKYYKPRISYDIHLYPVMKSPNGLSYRIDLTAPSHMKVTPVDFYNMWMPLDAARERLIRMTLCRDAILRLADPDK